MSLDHILLGLQLLGTCWLAYTAWYFRRLYLKAVREHNDFVLHVQRNMQIIVEHLRNKE